MNVRSIVVVVLAVVCGLSAAWGVSQLRQSSQGMIKPETAPIVLAAIRIPRGRMVTGDDIKVGQWPEEMFPEGALSKVEDAVARSATIPISPGEPILDAKLAAKDAGRGLAALIPNGMRAYTIQASRAASNVAGFVLPGNRVDVLLNLRGRQNDETGGGSTTTLLQSVEILAVDQRLDAPAENKVDPKALSSVTLLVTPEQAALLDLGQNMGQLTLALRNPEDQREADTRPATLTDIRFRQEKPAEQSAAEEAAPTPAGEKKDLKNAFCILTLKGGHRGLVRVTLND